jgi:beta-lactamase regulating signal transducer with metallopeptidase domain
VLFLAVYDFILSKETFFTKNRWYLLSTPVLSFLIPLIKIPTFQKVVPQEFIVYLPEIVLNPDKVIQQSIQQNSFETSANYINILFLIGVCVFSVLFLIKLFKVINFIRKHKVIKQDDFNLILIPNETKAFSFFNYVFLGQSIKEINRDKIIQHELVHSKQKHSLDLLLFEILKIVMWFNPMIYFYQKRITLVHEYISDAIVAKSETKETYINNLLSNFFQVENIAFVNQFYKQSLIKKRIIMMTKKQSKKMNQLKYLVLIPVLASMLFYVSCASLIPKTKSEITLLKKENKQLKDSLIDTKRKLENASSLNDYLPENQIGGRLSDGSVSYMKIDKAPTFPGCETGDKGCFSMNVQKHFALNFNSEIPKTLELSPGKKRVFIGFKIDKEGKVSGVKARAPHLKIEEEVIRVMNTLPKMIPGEHKGQKVDVKYSIPFTIFIEEKK